MGQNLYPTLYIPTLQNGLAKKLDVMHKFYRVFEICIEILNRKSFSKTISN